MGLKKEEPTVPTKQFELTWVDDVTATYPDVETDGRQHTYRFNVETENDAKAFVRSFIMLNGEHDFSKYSLRDITVKENQ